MAIRDQIMQMAQSDPKFAQAIDAMEKAVINMPVTPEDLEEVIQLLEFVVQNPDKYAEVRQAAIDDEEIDEDVLPPQFDMVYVVSLLVALYGLQDRLSQQGYARGGLTVGARRLAAQGRGGDTMLAHINPREAEMLRRAGGSGGINPATGLREFRFNFGRVLAAVAPIALSLIAPGIGTAIGGAISSTLGVSAGLGGMLGSALIGGASSALSGGNPIVGAVTGGLGGGLGGALGGALGLEGPMANILGSGFIGAGTAAATGRNPLSGAFRGALGAGIGELGGQAGNALGVGPGTEQAGIGRGLEAGAKMFGAGLGAGMKPGEAAVAGGLAGLASGMMKPSQVVVSNMQNQPQSYEQAMDQQALQAAGMVSGPGGAPMNAPGSSGVLPDGRPGIYQLNSQTGQVSLVPVPGSYQFNPQTNTVEFARQEQNPIARLLGQPAVPATTGGQQGGGLLGGLLGGGQGGINPAMLLAGAAALSSMRSAPAQAQQAVSTLSPSQQEYFNRPSVTWDWNKMQRDAAASGMGLGQYMATNWPRITSGQYNATGMAQGGALSAVARFARGAGTGRSDEIDAKLSDGEYVMDAETVAMLGDGSSKAGAQRLDKMREAIRAHKGKALSKGKFSPDAKSPLAYLKGVA